MSWKGLADSFGPHNIEFRNRQRERQETEMPKLASSLLFGGGLQEFEPIVDVVRMRKERAERLRTIMKKHDLAVVLLTKGDNVRYAAGTSPAPLPPGLSYCLFSVEGDTYAWDFPGDFQQALDLVPWIKPGNFRIAHYWHAGACGPEATQENARLFAADIRDALQQEGLVGERLGVAGFDGSAIKALNEAGIETVDASFVMLEARTVKTRDEIACLKQAAAIADAGFYAIYEALRPGVRDIDVQAAAVKTIIEAGGQVIPNTVVIFSGPHTWPRGFVNTDRIIRPGDIVYVDMAGMSYLGYMTCIYRTFKVGSQPTAKEKDWYQKTLEKQNAAIDAIKPGKTTADVAKFFTPASEWGYPDEVHALSLDIAHGVGLSGHEAPIISRLDSFKFPQVLEVGMVLALETITGEWRTGGTRIEDMVVITEDGAEMLDRTPRDQIIVTHSMV